MVKKYFSVTVLETRVGTVTARMEIEAVNDQHADALRDQIYDTIHAARTLLAPLQHITASQDDDVATGVSGSKG